MRHTNDKTASVRGCPYIDGTHLLVPRASTAATKLLGLATPRISDKQCAVVRNKSLFELYFALLIGILLVIRNDRL